MKPISSLSCSPLSRRSVLAMALGLSACSGGGSNGDAAPPGGVARLTLQPATLELDAGATQQFVALREGQAIAVDWSLVSGAGTLGGDGLYTAPASVPEAGLAAVVRAVARDDARVRGEASIRVRGAAVGDELLVGAVLAFTGPESISMKRQELVSESLSKALLAGRLSGQGGYVGYGTVSPSENGLQWQPVPTDRLVMNYLDGSRREYAFVRLAGDPVLLLRYDHDIEVTVSEGIEFRLHFTQSRRGTGVRIAIDGTVLFDGNTVQVDLVSQEVILRDAGHGGAVNYRADESLTGSLRLPGIEVAVDDQGEYEARFTPSQTPHRDVFVVRHARQCRSSYVVGNQRFELRAGELTRILGNSAPIDAYAWRAAAELVRGGASIGRIVSAMDGRVLSAVVELGGRSRQALRAEF